MTGLQLATAGLLVVALIAQAALPRLRLLTVTSCALGSMVASRALGGAGAAELLRGVPWDVLVIVVCLGLFTEALAASRIFGRLAVVAAELSRGRAKWVTLVFVGVMYVVSGVVNNLTALLVLLPVLLNLLALVGTSRRHLSWTLGAVLVACNLGGAATPIGDFPAILLLGRGTMTFLDYMVVAFPQTLVALAAFVVAVLVVRPERGLAQGPLSAELALTSIRALYRNVTLDRRLVGTGAGALAAMIAVWCVLPAGWGPDVVAWAGAAVLLWARPSLGESLVRRRVDVEAALFLLSLFVLVGAVRGAGTFELAGELLRSAPLSPRAQVMLFFVAAALMTGLFSAGPGMAALLDVAETLARHHPPHVIYVGLAMSVCAGSSLFLTAATSGPLAQALTDRAALRLADGVGRFGFIDYAPVGLVGFTLTLAVGLGFAWSSLG